MRLITFVFVFTLFLIVVLAVSTLTVVFLLAFLLLVVLNSYLVRSFADISSSFSQLLDFEHEFECINATDLPVIERDYNERQGDGLENYFTWAQWRINATANRRLAEERQADTVRQPRLDLYLTDAITICIWR